MTKNDPFESIREQAEYLKSKIKETRLYYHNERLRRIVDCDYRGEHHLGHKEYYELHYMKTELYQLLRHMPPLITVRKDGVFQVNEVVVDISKPDGSEMIRILREAAAL